VHVTAEIVPSSRDILVVEDHPGNRRLLDLILTSLGHQVTLAENGFIALAEVRRRPFDVVLMDISMPGIDGIETCRRIRALDLPWAGLPIVALTAHVAADVVAATEKAGMTGFLAKPVDHARLAQTVAEAGFGHRA
jgi:two-component system sensor histidine kinase TorS